MSWQETPSAGLMPDGRLRLTHGPIDLMLGRLTQCGPATAVIPLSDQVWGNFESIMEPVQTNQAAFSFKR